jgi:hypothetical protein
MSIPSVLSGDLVAQSQHPAPARSRIRVSLEPIGLTLYVTRDEVIWSGTRAGISSDDSPS